MAMTRPEPTPGAKMHYLIRRRPTTSRDELIAHWFANHMPAVIARNSGADGAARYVATLFDQEGDAPPLWDGVAQLWMREPLPRPPRPSGDPPQDTFQEKVEPYWPWATQEWVFVDGALPLDPPTLNPPFPCTRSGFLKQISLVKKKPGIDDATLMNHWLDVHGPNVRETMQKVGGFRYVVNLSLDPENAPYFGLPELYFPDRAAQTAFWDALEPDGFTDLVEHQQTARYRCTTEMVGIE